MGGADGFQLRQRRTDGIEKRGASVGAVVTGNDFANLSGIFVFEDIARTVTA